MIGTLINFSTVIVGGTLGLAISGRLPERIKVIVVAAIGLALNILDIKRIKVANLLPALIIAPLIVIHLNTFGIPLNFGLGGH